jgi:hypothetical protein
MRHYLKCIILLLIVSFIPHTHSQNLINDFSGIPVIANYWWGFNNPLWSYPKIIDTMKSVGINFISQDMEPHKVDTIKNLWGLKIIPTSSYATDTHSDTINWVEYYTDAKYTVWKTARTLLDTSYLQHKSTVMDEVTSGGETYIKLKDTSAKYRDTLIKGPYYYQGLHYYTGHYDTILYQAEFRMKLENNLAHQDSLSLDNPYSTDTLCIIQVTHSIQDTHSFDLISTVVDTQDAIIRSRFTSLNEFKTFPLTYKFDNYSNSSESLLNKSVYHCYGNNGVIALEGRQYVQFKVIWLGNPHYLISIDNVTVSEDRGRKLKDPTSEAFTNIINQVSSLSSYPDLVGSWTGIDEPNSYDNYEPIRIVDSLVTQYGNHAKVLYSFMGKWDGVFENKNNPWGTYHLSPWIEMAKRVETDKLNICQDMYYFDYPYRYNYGGSDSACNCEDFRAKNIAVTGYENYKQAYNLNSDFGVSLQCGCIHREQAIERNINAPELLYSANLALLFGAKFLSLYTFMAQRDVDNTDGSGTIHAIIDYDASHNFIYTDKLNMFRDTLGPRLKGLFGQTIKKLIPTDQYVGTQGINLTYDLPGRPGNNFILGDNYQECIDYILPMEDTSPCYYYVDYGYFRDTTSELTKKYFMIINRYYSEFIHHEIGLKWLDGFTNWNLTSYSDTVSNTIQATVGLAYFHDTIHIGDAKLYSIMPVAMYGGEFKYSETITSNTLSEEMIIDSTATLTITGTYNANANIIIKPGGNLIVAPGGHLNFANGCHLIYTCPQITLKALIEGFYNGSTMVPDTITVELHDAASPYGLVASNKRVLDSTGYGTFYFTTAANDTPYYFVIKHRNSIETWSAAALSFSSDTLTYDFTTDSTKAYGCNMVKVGTKWCLYSGDVNQDGSVDGTDLGIVYIDDNDFVTGYTVTDVNGDSSVDGTDLGIVDNNNNKFVGKLFPGGQAVKRVKHHLKLGDKTKL